MPPRGTRPRSRPGSGSWRAPGPGGDVLRRAGERLRLGIERDVTLTAVDPLRVLRPDFGDGGGAGVAGEAILPELQIVRNRGRTLVRRRAAAPLAKPSLARSVRRLPEGGRRSDRGTEDTWRSGSRWESTLP